jgi:hypothetical protein
MSARNLTTGGRDERRGRKLAPELAPDELEWTDFNCDAGGWRLRKTPMKSGILT